MTPFGTAPTVLVVEDGRIAREALARLLQQEGYTAVTAPNGGEAVEKVRSGLQPDLVLMDVNMPEMDGLTALSLLRQEPQFGGTPVVFYSAQSDPETVERARRLGAAAYLVKARASWPDIRETVRRHVA